MGYLYRPSYRDKDGERREARKWWVQYFIRGRRVRESTGTTERGKAVNFLRAREGRVAAGEPVQPRVEKIRYEEVAEDLRRDYRTTGRRDVAEAELRLRHLGGFFAGRLIADLTGADLTAYAAKRQAQGAANGTINRELAVLRRMLRLAYEHGKLLRLPVIRGLKEAPPRAGFFEREQYEAVRRHLRPDLQVVCDLAYAFGWRVRDEVLTLKRAQVDLQTGTVRLEPGSTKNREGRVVFLTPALAEGLRAQLARVDALQRQLGRVIPYVFPNFEGPCAGQRLQDFKRAWKTACRTAGVPGRLRHDFRRTAVRNLVNDGTPEKVAMLITGHKTRSVFDRYHIVAPEDLKAAAARIAARDGHRPHVRGQEVREG